MSSELDSPSSRVPLDALTALVRGAGREVLSWYARRSEVTWKEDGSPLTLADRASHKFLVRGLETLLPGVPVLSEESAAEEIRDRADWETFWLVDPLDGTKEFVKGTGEFTVNVALVEGARPVIGVVDVPQLKRCYRAAPGVPTEVAQDDGPFMKVHTRVPPDVAPVLVASRDHAGSGVRAFATGLGEGVQFTSAGSSLKFCLVAEGRADFYLRDLPTMEWDTAAAQCVVERAGGAVFSILGTDGFSSLKYNKESLKNPPFIAVGRPDGSWREIIEVMNVEAAKGTDG